jgi:alpha-glucosidase
VDRWQNACYDGLALGSSTIGGEKSVGKRAFIMPWRNGIGSIVVGIFAALALTELSSSQEPGSASTRQNQTQIQNGQSQIGQQDQQQSESRRGQRGDRRRSRDDRRSRSRRSQRVRMEQIEVASPDGNVRLVLAPNAERLTYSVKMGDATVVEPSALRLVVDSYDLPSGVVLGTVETCEIDEKYPWHGAHSTAVNKCRGARIALTHDLSMTAYTLEVRAFNDGVAYRLIVPGDDAIGRVVDEYSNFVLPAGTTVWFHDLDGHYEAAYEQKSIEDVTAGQWAGPPLTFQLPGGAGYGSITEANLVNYAGMALECDGRRGWVVGLGHRHPLNYPYELRYGREEGKRLGKPAAIEGTITTPWRVIMLGRDLNTLVNCDILPNLCPPADESLFPEGMNTDWVAPGLAVWDYVDRNYAGEPGRGYRAAVGPRSDELSRFEHMKNFSRMGGEIGARYHILEGFAYGWSDDEVREFVDYSTEHSVRTLFWRHSRQLRTPEAREEFFSRLKRLGVAGAKIDFIDHEAKESVDLYEDLLRDAARHQLVIDFHGANKPTGRLRTWPNDMLREAVRGMESSSLQERARHEAILPFTRYLAGPADYTTMIFTERRRDSSWAHQIACLATFHSPMLTIAAHPQSVLDNPALDVIKSIPAVWDETIVLPDSRIGELSIFARRKGDMWMLAVMCGTDGRTITVPLSFLGDGKYRASVVRDDMENDAAVVLNEHDVDREESLLIKMRNGGGFVARFTKH